MSDIEIKLTEFELWWRKGNFYNNCRDMITDDCDDIVVINSKFCIKDDFVGDMLDFVRVFDASNYFDLYKYPVEIYIYYLFNEDEVLEYMNNKLGTYEKLFIERLKYYKEIIHYKIEIIKHMVFQEDELINKYGSIYTQKLESLKKSKFYNINYTLCPIIYRFEPCVTLKLMFDLKNNPHPYLFENFKIFEEAKYGRYISAFKLISEKIRNLEEFRYHEFSYYKGILNIYEMLGPKYKYLGSVKLNITELNRNLIADMFQKIYNESLELCKKRSNTYITIY